MQLTIAIGKCSGNYNLLIAIGKCSGNYNLQLQLVSVRVIEIEIGET